MACGFGLFPFFRRDCEDRCKACACSACGCGSCACGCGSNDDKKIAVITAVRAIAAKGDGCFDKIGRLW